MERYKIAVGDWSQDGHNMYKEYIVETSMEKKDILDSYLETVAETGITLSNYFYPPSFIGCGIGESGKIKGKEILADYEEGSIDQEDARTLWNAGYRFGCETEEEFEESLKDEYSDVCSFGLSEIVDLYIWYVLRNRPNETMEVVYEKLDYIVGFWNKYALGGIGYGLFSN